MSGAPMNCSLTASRQPSWISCIQSSTCFRGGMSFITEVEGHYQIYRGFWPALPGGDMSGQRPCDRATGGVADARRGPLSPAYCAPPCPSALPPSCPGGTNPESQARADQTALLTGGESFWRHP